MRIGNIAEHISTAANRLRVQKDLLPDLLANKLIGEEPSPFLAEDSDYTPDPVILRPGPTIRSLDFSTGNGYPKVTDNRMELTNDFTIVDMVRDKVETALYEGYGTTYDWGRFDARHTAVQVNLKSDKGTKFSVSVKDNVSTLGSLIRTSDEIDIRQRAFPKKRLKNEIKKPIKEYESRHGNNQAQWVSRDSELSICKTDTDETHSITAKFDRNGKVSVTVTEILPVSSEERRKAVLEIERYISQEKFREYRKRNPDFRDDLKKIAASTVVHRVNRPATPEEETQFWQDFVGTHVDLEETQKSYEKEIKKFSFTGDMHNMGRGYWINNEKRSWYQKS